MRHYIHRFRLGPGVALAAVGAAGDEAEEGAGRPEYNLDLGVFVKKGKGLWVCKAKGLFR